MRLSRQLVAAGVHVRTYAADAPLYIHAKMILTPTRTFLGSENFSDESLFDNRELGIVLSTPSITASLHHTFDTDYAGAQPFTAAAPPAGSSARPPSARPAPRTRASTTTTTCTSTQTSPWRR